MRSFVTASLFLAFTLACSAERTVVDGGPGDDGGISPDSIDYSLVSDVSIAPTPAILNEGDSTQLLATLRMKNGRIVVTQRVTWSVVDASVASITDKGLLRGRRQGITRVRASAGSQAIEGGVSVVQSTPLPAPVRSVRITAPVTTLRVGDGVALSATPLDSTGQPLAGRAVTWSTSQPAVATVGSTGVVTGVAPGTVTITAMSEGITATQELSVTAVPVAAVAITPSAPSLLVGAQLQLAADVRDSANRVLTDRPVAWSSANTGVATIDGQGRLTGVAAGTAQVTATVEGRTATVTATVSLVPVATLAVSPATLSLVTGATGTLTATARDAAGNTLTGRPVAWSTSNAGIATVASGGVVTAVAPGSATITATSEGRTATAAITVTAPPPAAVASVTLAPTTLALNVGGTGTLSATLRDASGNVLTGRTVTWASSATGVATVSGGGVVTATGAGSATITATSEGRSATASVTVAAPPPAAVASVSVTPGSLSLTVGQGTATLSATPRDASGSALTGRTVSWSSSNPGIATVSGGGIVTPVAAGSATITATSEGIAGSASVSVAAAPPPSSAWPNEPSGSTRQTERSFGALNEDGWLAPMGYFSIVDDPTAPRSGSTVGQARYPAGFNGGTEPVRLEKSFSQRYSTMYVSFWIKMSDNFVGHSTGVNKILHLWVAGGNRIYLTAQGSGAGPLLAQINLQGVPIYGARNLPPNVVTGAQIQRGRWQRWEVVVRTNTPGVSNGFLEWWVDGVRVGSHSDLQFIQGTESPLWEHIQWAPTWGGIGGTVTADQFMWIDHLYVSGR